MSPAAEFFVPLHSCSGVAGYSILHSDVNSYKQLALISREFYNTDQEIQKRLYTYQLLLFLN
jgi:hypothetical protein